MKNLFTALMLLCMAILGYSCRGLDGIGEPIEFTPENSVCGYNAQELVLKSKNNLNWWLCELGINGRNISFNISDEVKITKHNENPSEITKVESEWFIWERVDNTHIRISLKENSDKVRTLKFTTQYQNGFQVITITQEARQ